MAFIGILTHVYLKCIRMVLAYDLQEKRAASFTCIVFFVSGGCYYSVYLPHGAMSWYQVCDCGISLSYLLLCADALFLYVASIICIARNERYPHTFLKTLVCK